jgi:hypothetical protein
MPQFNPSKVFLESVREKWHCVRVYTVTIYSSLPVIIPLTLHTLLSASDRPDEPHLYEHKWCYMYHDAGCNIFGNVSREMFLSVKSLWCMYPIIFLLFFFFSSYGRIDYPFWISRTSLVSRSSSKFATIYFFLSTSHCPDHFNFCFHVFIKHAAKVISARTYTLKA